MHRNAFGNLQEWGRVLEQLESISRGGDLDRHQADLIALLRYPDNWRLREAALESSRNLRKPTRDLVDQIRKIMADNRLYCEVRVLAAEALAVLLERWADSSDPGMIEVRREVQSEIHALLESHQPPVLHQAARRVLPKVD